MCSREHLCVLWKKNARGGVGVWFGENDSKNISIKLNSNRPTNQLAELTAIYMALEVFGNNLNTIKLYIYTDSDYSIKCITRYCKYWGKNNWKKKDGCPIKNLDIIKKIYKYYISYSHISFIHVKAHTNLTDKGNYLRAGCTGCMHHDMQQMQASTCRHIEAKSAWFL